MSQPEHQQKKRLRVPVSCEECRRRKIKCDRIRPICSGCVRSKLACKYEEVKSTESAHNFKHILNFGSFQTGAAASTASGAASAPRTQKAQQAVFDSHAGQPKRPRHAIIATDQASHEQLANWGASGSPGTHVSPPTPKTAQQKPTVAATAAATAAARRPKRHFGVSDVIDFHEGYSSLQINDSRVFNHGPLSWVTLVKKDVYVKTVWTKVLTTSARSSLILQSTNCVEEDVRDADDSAPAGSEHKEPQHRPRALGYSTVHRPDSELGTIQLVLKILPEKRHIWALVDRFFTVVYPFMPYLDHENFLKQITKIIGPWSMDGAKLKQLSITKRLDFATVGILLLVLRFAHLSIQNNADDYSQYTSAELRRLLDVNISVDFPTAAQYCLNQFRLLRSSNLEILQCTLYMRLYHRFSPEDGDGADTDSRIYNGMLLQMAISIGLNRDPEELMTTGANPKLYQLRRKIWFALLQLESYHSLVLGDPSYTTVLSYSAKHPELNLNEFNSPSEDIEKFVIYWSTRYCQRMPILNRLNDLLLNLQGDTKVADIVFEIERMEELVQQAYQSFSRVLKMPTDTHAQGIYKVRSIQSYLELNSTIFCIYFHLFLKYDTRASVDNALYYFKKIIAISNELMKTVPHLENNLQKFVGYGFDFYLTHSALIALHRVIQGQFSFYARLSHYKCLLALSEGNDALITAATAVTAAILQTVACHIRELKLLTPKYYYAWKMFKAQNAIYDLLSTDELFRVKDGKVVGNVEGDISAAVPQYSIFAKLSAQELQDLYPKSKGRKARKEVPQPPAQDHKTRTQGVATSPAALSHILNSTPTNSTSSLSPDPQSREQLATFTTKEIDDIWLDLLNKKKENDIDEVIRYNQEIKVSDDAEQLRQLQQPDFSSLLVMQPSLSDAAKQQQQQQQPDGRPPAGKTAPAFAGDGYNYPAGGGGWNTGTGAGAGQLPAQAAPQNFQPTPSDQSGKPHGDFSLNGLLEDPLNFNQLFGTSDNPFKDFV